MSKNASHSSFSLEQTSVLKMKYPFLSASQIKKRVQTLWDKLPKEQKTHYVRQPVTPARKLIGSKFFKSPCPGTTINFNKPNGDLFDQVVKPNQSAEYDFNLDSEGLSQRSDVSSPVNSQQLRESTKKYISSDNYFVNKETPVIVHLSFTPQSTILKSDTMQRKRRLSRVSFSADVKQSPGNKKRKTCSSPGNVISKTTRRSLSHSPLTRSRTTYTKRSPNVPTKSSTPSPSPHKRGAAKNLKSTTPSPCRKGAAKNLKSTTPSPCRKGAAKNLKSTTPSPCRKGAAKNLKSTTPSPCRKGTAKNLKDTTLSPRRKGTAKNPKDASPKKTPNRTKAKTKQCKVNFSNTSESSLSSTRESPRLRARTESNVSLKQATPVSSVRQLKKSTFPKDQTLRCTRAKSSQGQTPRSTRAKTSLDSLDAKKEEGLIEASDSRVYNFDAYTNDSDDDDDADCLMRFSSYKEQPAITNQAENDVNVSTTSQTSVAPVDEGVTGDSQDSDDEGGAIMRFTSAFTDDTTETQSCIDDHEQLLEEAEHVEDVVKENIKTGSSGKKAKQGRPKKSQQNASKQRRRSKTTAPCDTHSSSVETTVDFNMNKDFNEGSQPMRAEEGKLVGQDVESHCNNNKNFNEGSQPMGAEEGKLVGQDVESHCNKNKDFNKGSQPMGAEEGKLVGQDVESMSYCTSSRADNCFGFEDTSILPNNSQMSSSLARRSSKRLTSTPKPVNVTPARQTRSTTSTVSSQSSQSCPRLTSSSGISKSVDPIRQTPQRRSTRKGKNKNIEVKKNDVNSFTTTEKRLQETNESTLKDADINTFKDNVDGCQSPEISKDNVGSSVMSPEMSISSFIDSTNSVSPSSSPGLREVAVAGSVNRSIAAMRQIVSAECEQPLSIPELSDLSDVELSDNEDPVNTTYTANMAVSPVGECQPDSQGEPLSDVDETVTNERESQYWDDGELFIQQPTQEGVGEIMGLFSNSTRTPGSRRFLSSSRGEADSQDFSHLFSDGSIFM